MKRIIIFLNSDYYAQTQFNTEQEARSEFLRLKTVKQNQFSYQLVN